MTDSVPLCPHCREWLPGWISEADRDKLRTEVDRLTAVVEAAKGIHIKSDRDGQPVIIGMLALSNALAALEEKT